MADYTIYEPSTGQRAGSVPAPGASAGAYTNELAGEWAPNDAPLDPHCDAFEIGDGAPSTGSAPDNITGGDMDADFDDSDEGVQGLLAGCTPCDVRW